MCTEPGLLGLWCGGGDGGWARSGTEHRRRTQIWTVLSQPAERIKFSSVGWNLTENTLFECPGVIFPMPRDRHAICDLVASS